MRYVPSERGHLKLLLNGYVYTKQVDTVTHIVWRCCDRRNCHARLWQFATSPEKIVLRKEHSHPPDWERYKRAAANIHWRPPRQRKQ